MLRRLDELSNDELKHEFVKAGLEGEDEEALMVVKMTIHIVKVLKKDPFSFKFVVNEEKIECAADSSSWLADVLSEETSVVSSPGTLSVQVGSSSNLENEYSVLSSSLLADDVPAEPTTVGSSLMFLSSPSFLTSKVTRDVSISRSDVNEVKQESTVPSTLVVDGSSEETSSVSSSETLFVHEGYSLQSKDEFSVLSSSLLADVVSAVGKLPEAILVGSSLLSFSSPSFSSSRVSCLNFKALDELSNEQSQAGMLMKGRLLDILSAKPIVWPPDRCN